MNLLDPQVESELTSRSIKKINSILENASRLFVQYGYHKVTMESIAQYASVSKVTLYKYFDDKQALFEYILMKNYLVEFKEVVEIINSPLPFEEKINEVVKSRIKKYYDKSVPIFQGEITLSLQIQKFIREYTAKMEVERKKLYDQGKDEGFICEDITDETLEVYFKIIQNGLVSVFKDLGELENEKLTRLLKILYAGVLGCR